MDLAEGEQFQAPSLMLLDRNAAWMLTTRATCERVNRDALDALAGGEHRRGGGLNRSWGGGLGQRPTYSRAEKYCGRRMDRAEPNFEASAEAVNRQVPCNRLSGR
jgi:hypothetical protein